MFTHSRIIKPILIYAKVFLIFALFTSGNVFSEDFYKISPDSTKFLLASERSSGKLFPYYHGLSAAKIEYSIVNNTGEPISLQIYNDRLKRFFIKRNITKLYQGISIIPGKGFYFSVINNNDNAYVTKDFVIKFKIIEVFDDLSDSGREAGAGRPNHIWHNWDTISKAPLDPEVITLIKSLGRGVVRLKTPLVSSCYSWGGGTLRDNNGCTAFRISDDLFATNWHCLSESMTESHVGARSCENASITFSYAPPSSKLSSNSTSWGIASEACQSIEYINSRLDFAIFRTTRRDYEVWKGFPILRILPNTASYPQTTTQTSRFGDRLAILHYPRAKSCKNYDSDYDYNIFENNENNFVKNGYQTKLKVSTYSENSPYCRVWVMRKGKFDVPVQIFTTKNKEEGSVKAIIGTDHAPESVCDEDPRDPSPKIGLLHRCDTCAGSSGSPLISTQPGTLRFGTVVGIHAGHFSRNRSGILDFSGNYAIRMSKIAECLDLATIGNTNQIEFSSSASGSAACKSEYPSDAPHLDCSANSVDGDCQFYNN